jgi:tRNA G26 N,N-dimethylase Trm1
MITQENFDRILLEILSQQKANQLIDIPGIYEIVSEFYNNDILRIHKQELADKRKDGSNRVFKNYYYCERCGEEWDDMWDTSCDDQCPECNAEINPYKSEELY